MQGEGAGLVDLVNDVGAAPDQNVIEDELVGPDQNMIEDELAGLDQNKIEDKLAGPDGNMNEDEPAGPDGNVTEAGLGYLVQDAKGVAGPERDRGLAGGTGLRPGQQLRQRHWHRRLPTRRLPPRGQQQG